MRGSWSNWVGCRLWLGGQECWQQLWASLCSLLLLCRALLTEGVAQVSLRLGCIRDSSCSLILLHWPLVLLPPTGASGWPRQAVGDSCVSLQGSGAFAAALAAWR